MYYEATVFHLQSLKNLFSYYFVLNILGLLSYAQMIFISVGRRRSSRVSRGKSRISVRARYWHVPPSLYPSQSLSQKSFMYVESFSFNLEIKSRSNLITLYARCLHTYGHVLIQRIVLHFDICLEKIRKKNHFFVFGHFPKANFFSLPRLLRKKFLHT